MVAVSNKTISHKVCLFLFSFVNKLAYEQNLENVVEITNSLQVSGSYASNAFVLVRFDIFFFIGVVKWVIDSLCSKAV